MFLQRYLGDQVTDVGQNPASSQVNLPVCWLDQFLVQAQIFHRTLSSNTQLIKVTDKQSYWLDGHFSLFIEPSTVLWARITPLTTVDLVIIGNNEEINYCIVL